MVYYQIALDSYNRECLSSIFKLALDRMNINHTVFAMSIEFSITLAIPKSPVKFKKKKKVILKNKWHKPY